MLTLIPRLNLLEIRLNLSVISFYKPLDFVLNKLLLNKIINSLIMRNPGFGSEKYFPKFDILETR